MLTTAAICVGIAAVTFIVRATPGIGFFGGDSGSLFHLALADVIRKDRDRQKFVRYFSVGTYNDYPVLLHSLLSVIPKKTLEKIGGLISPFFDALNAVLVYWLCIELTGSNVAGIAAWLFYLASPQMELESIGLTPRVLGALLFNLWIVAMMVGLQSVSSPWAFVSILAGAACFHTMRMPLPLMLIVGPALWAATGNPTYAVLEACALAAAFLLNTKHFSATLTAYWAMNFGKGAGRADDNKLNGYLNTVLRILFIENFSVLVMFAAGLWVAVTGHGDAHLLMKRILWYWFLIAFVIFLAAVFVPRFARGGDGVRRLPMLCALPGAVLSGIAVQDAYKYAPALFWALAAGFAVSYILTLRMTLPGFKNKLKSSPLYMGNDLKTILKRVAGYPFGGVMCLPDTNNNAMIYHGGKRVVDVIERGGRNGRNSELAAAFRNRLKRPIADNIKLFELDYFFIDTSSSWSKDIGALGEVVEREGPYVFLRVKKELKK